jgi:hypothetical protein
VPVALRHLRSPLRVDPAYPHPMSSTRRTLNPVGAENAVRSCDVQILGTGRRAGHVAAAALTQPRVGERPALLIERSVRTVCMSEPVITLAADAGDVVNRRPRRRAQKA